MCESPYKINYKHPPNIKKSIDIICIENGPVVFVYIENKHTNKQAFIFIFYIIYLDIISTRNIYDDLDFNNI